MRTAKQRTHDERALSDLWEHDRLACHLLRANLLRDEGRFDVFGNPCKCYLTDEGEWSSKMCPVEEHGTVP